MFIKIVQIFAAAGEATSPAARRFKRPELGRYARCALAAVIMASPLFFCPPSVTFASSEIAFKAEKSLPMWGALREERLAPIARVAALLEALDKAADALRARTMVNIGLSAPLQRLAVALTVHDVEFATEISQGVPSLLKAVATLRPTSEGLDKALPKALADSRMYAWRKAALAFIMPRSSEAVELVRRAFETGAEQVFSERIDFLGAQMAAWLLLYESWRPDIDPRQALRLGRQGLALDRHNPVLWAAVGERLLTLDQPLEAISLFDNAMALNPELSSALYLRGLAHMRLNQLALAESDFSQALKLDPDHPEWLRARGAVRMLKEEHGPMCEDFFAACSLGDCEGLALARKKGLCPGK